MCELLGRASINDNGTLQLPHETVANRAVAATLAFLVDQRWLAENSAETWTVTPAGRFWFHGLNYGDAVKFHEYGGAVFLLHVISSGSETVVWHKGRFATISIKYVPQPEHFVVRRENEPITTTGGTDMQEALAVACGLLAENLEVPQPPQREDLRLHMLKYMEQL